MGTDDDTSEVVARREEKEEVEKQQQKEVALSLRVDVAEKKKFSSEGDADIDVEVLTDGTSVVRVLLVCLDFLLVRLDEEDNALDSSTEATSVVEDPAMEDSKGDRNISAHNSLPKMGRRVAGAGLGKHSSMPTMTGNLGGFGRGESRGDSDESDYDDEAGVVSGEIDVSTPSPAKDKAIEVLEKENLWKDFRRADSARDCLISLVMSIDADEDGGCKRAISKKSSQGIVVQAIGQLKHDREAVTAGCMLLRSVLKNAAKERMAQVSWYIENGLADSINAILEIHEKDTGSVNTEVSALMEELGTQFEHALNPL